MLLSLALLTGCLQDQPLPDVGACADYPDGLYDYGLIGIGTCIAGPAALATAQNDGDGVLLVSNSNHLATFTGGSLLAIPWDSIDLDIGRNVISDLPAAAVDLPDFSAGLGLWDQDSDGDGDLAVVTTRYSADSLVRSDDDQVWLVDVSDARNPVLSSKGEDGSSTVTVEADPTDAVVDPDSGMAYVVNRTAHSVSVLDMTGELVEIVLPWPEQTVSQTTLDDADGSGSTGELSTLDITDSTLVPDEEWDLDWSAGSWRVWTPQADGLSRSTTSGDGIYWPSGIGAELDPADSDGAITEVSDPSALLLGSALYMYFVDQGAVRVAIADTALFDWALQDTVSLDTDDSRWDAVIEGPSAVVTADAFELFYGASDGQDGTLSAIGRATSTDGVNFTRAGNAVLEPTWDHEAGGIADPSVFYDSEVNQWRMVYGAFDGSRWTIGHAVSDDAHTWQSDASPIFEVSGVDVAAPVVTAEAGNYRMWYARDDGTGWSIGAASSPDGWTWTDQGTVLELDEAVDSPPGPAVQATVDRLFRLQRQTSGDLVAQVESGGSVSLPDQGLDFSVVSGFQMGVDAGGSITEGGISLSSVDPSDGTAWYTVTDAGGTPAIGIGAVDGQGDASVETETVLDGEETYESRGVSDPVVVHTDSGYVMLYGGLQRSSSTIARATSDDGRTWARSGEVLTAGSDWESVDILPGSIIVQDDGSWRLFYSGSDGETWYIGEASSDDQGATWVRQEGASGYSFATGSPGWWDDSGVRDPYVIVGSDGVWQMWYAGFDGDVWRVGYATRDGIDGTWTRFEDPVSQEKRAILGISSSLFHPDGALRPVVLTPSQNSDLGGNGLDWQGWYAGRLGDVDRQGLALGRSPNYLHRVFRVPTPGDSLSFTTQRGDDTARAIPLDATVQGSTLTGWTAASLTLDRERGFLYVTGQLRPYVFVIDVRDDSPLPDGSNDDNYLDLEAVIVATNASGADGFRQVVTVPGQDYLLAINDSPDAVWVVDLSQLEDDGQANLIYDAIIGYIPSPRGVARDEGVPTLSDVGAGRLLLHPDGRHLFVSNFNANSIGLYDLAIGPFGSFVQEVMNVGENPFAMTLSPDGKYLAFGNYTGEVGRDVRNAESTLGVLDVDPDSPTYFEVQTWITNR
ncbi:MAG: beta-propeller fold lactonase family protein [Oligoflexia bacterium]|nr:beta-propeller fold lactonase family protein [Oligoflexia bacterium]